MFQIRHQGIGHSRYSGCPQFRHQRPAGQVFVGQRIRWTDRVAKRVASVLVAGKFRFTVDFDGFRVKLPVIPNRLDSTLTDFRPAALFFYVSGGTQQHTIPVHRRGVRPATRLLVSAELSSHTATGPVSAGRPRLHVRTVRLPTRLSRVSQRRRSLLIITLDIEQEFIKQE